MKIVFINYIIIRMLTREKLMEKLRVEKAVEIKSNFKKLLKKSMNEISELEPFVNDINEWVRYNSYASGNVYVKCLDKYVVYQLNEIDHTVVKVTDKLNK
jgi:hypothetical protein